MGPGGDWRERVVDRGTPRPRSGSTGGPAVKQFWLSFFGTLAGVVAAAAAFVVFLAFVLGGLFASAVRDAESAASAALPSGALTLELDLREARFDQPSASAFGFARPLSVTEIALALDAAAQDPRVKTVFVRANTIGMAPGQAEEIRRALARFAAAPDRRVIAHAQGFEGPALANYLAVAGADELWLQDTASFSAAGYASETVFLGGLIERTGVGAEFVQMHEYKTAAEPFLSAGYTDAHREATLSWLGSLHATAIADLAEDRGIEAGRMGSLIAAAPYSAERALEAGLVDRLGHVAEAREAARTGDEGAETATIVSLDTYARARPRLEPVGDVIALVGAQGPIETGDGLAGFGGEERIGSDRLAAAIDAAARDASVRAIVIRIDSPGGSAVASDQIWDAIMRARADGKPVIASLGAVAASGGYYIAAPADRIAVNPASLTGSIGVVAGKLVLDGALDRVGVSLDTLSAGGEFATAWSSATPWTDSQRAAVEALAADTYEDFTERVAQGRDLPLARVQEIARGRIWTGAQALDLGLADSKGGLLEAIDLARELAGMPTGQAPRLKRFPAEPGAMEALRALFGSGAEIAALAARLDAVLALPEVRAALAARQTGPGVRLDDHEAAAAAAAAP